MSMDTYLQTASLTEIRRYDPEGDYRNNAVAFTGTPRKHPYDADKFLLIDTPFGQNTSFLEFRRIDVLFAEDLPNIVTESGESHPMMRVWLRTGCFGIRFTPFEVTREK